MLYIIILFLVLEITDRFEKGDFCIVLREKGHEAIELPHVVNKSFLLSITWVRKVQFCAAKKDVRDVC